MKVFLSYYSDEEAEAEDIANHLKSTFGSDEFEIFMASSWDSLAPGDAWEDKLIDAVEDADALLVLMSIDALGRSWINFEIGVAWAKKTRILLFCHKGLAPEALPRPYASLQAVDLNGLTHDERLQKVVEAVSRALDIRIREKDAAKEVALPEGDESFSATSRSWLLRTASHVGETARGRFLVGAVYPARPERARAAQLDPGDTLYVRLFFGQTPAGAFINAMVCGETASFFETVARDTTFIEANIRLAGGFEEGDKTVPLLVVEDSTVIPSP